MTQLHSILMVDDDPEICTLTERYFSLQAESLHFDYLNDARQVVAKVQDTQPDLIILDHGMPYMNGLGVMQALDDAFHDQAPMVIYQTAYPDYRDQALAAGAQDYLLKSETEVPALYERVQFHLAAIQRDDPSPDTLQLSLIHI